MIIGESMVISLIGGVLGMALTFPSQRPSGKILSTFFPIFKVPQEIFLMDLAAVVIVGLSRQSFQPGGPFEIRIADGLRRIG